MYEQDPLDASCLPVLGLNSEDKKFMSNKVKHAFPLSVNHWFKDLPGFIKVLVGTHDFYQAVHIYYKRACYSRLSQVLADSSKWENKRTTI